MFVSLWSIILKCFRFIDYYFISRYWNRIIYSYKIIVMCCGREGYGDSWGVGKCKFMFMVMDLVDIENSKNKMSRVVLFFEVV